VAAVIGAGIVPAGLEMMDRSATRAVEEFVHAGYPLDAAAVLLVETDGTPEEVAADMAEITRVLGAAGATGIRVSKDERERLLLWSGRKAAFPAIGRLTPDYYCMDGTIPRKALADVLLRIEALSERHKLRCANVFHAGDGNLHPLIMYDANVADESKRAEAFGAAILELCIEVGGTITGEHGVGIEKLPQMCVQFRPAELECFLAVKAAFDARALLNPGKGVPTLARCAEFGKMHVHHGQLPHPDLPRF
jgi:glycolate oxidase